MIFASQMVLLSTCSKVGNLTRKNLKPASHTGLGSSMGMRVVHKANTSRFRPCGKESTEVRKSQIKGKESEISYQELKRSPKDRHTQTHGNCIEIF